MKKSFLRYVLPVVGAFIGATVITWAQTRSVQLNQDNRGPILYNLSTQATTLPGAVSVGGNLTVAGTTTNSGNVTNTGVLTQTYTSTAAAPGTVRAIRGNATVGAGLTMTSGNLVGVRGELNVPSGTTTSAAGDYMYGVQGKFIGGGTLTDGNFCGLCGQIDASAGTYTAGVLSAAWLDMGASASASAVSTSFGGASQVLRMTNTTGAQTTQIMDIFANAPKFMSLDGPAAATDYVQSTTTNCGSGGAVTATKALYITVHGVDYFIPLCPTK